MHTMSYRKGLIRVENITSFVSRKIGVAQRKQFSFIENRKYTFDTLPLLQHPVQPPVCWEHLQIGKCDQHMLIKSDCSRSSHWYRNSSRARQLQYMQVTLFVTRPHIFMPEIYMSMYDNITRLFATSAERLAIADLARASIRGNINLDSIVADMSMSIV